MNFRIILQQMIIYVQFCLKNFLLIQHILLHPFKNYTKIIKNKKNVSQFLMNYLKKILKSFLGFYKELRFQPYFVVTLSYHQGYIIVCRYLCGFYILCRDMASSLKTRVVSYPGARNAGCNLTAEPIGIVAAANYCAILMHQICFCVY